MQRTEKLAVAIQRIFPRRTSGVSNKNQSGLGHFSFLLLIFFPKLYNLSPSFSSSAFPPKIASVEAGEDSFTALASVFYLNAAEATSNGERLSNCDDNVYNCPTINMESLETGHSIYEFKFIEEDGGYKLTGVTKK
ncbi:hypothetical protein IJI02_00315 [Candidatus Saccharibacteria bacterium]|nr:hypothetical protein [Candidatus Saccharibacteria bacterium]